MIITTDKLSSLAEIFENLDSSALVIFDVDDVLFEPRDQILRGHYFKEVLIFENMIEAKYDKNTAEELYSIIWNERQIQVMEEETPLLIAHLQEKNIPVIALTNCMIGRYGLTSSVEDWRLGELAKCGYYLEKSWVGLEEKIFEHKDETDQEKRWLYKKGVIFANGIQKGAVLEEFLKHFKVNPKHIIFVDDLLKNVISVQDMCAKLNIDFTGIEYTKATSSYSRPNNLSIAKVQAQTLGKERKWLTDKEARALQTNVLEDNLDEGALPLENLNIQKISPIHDSLESVIVYSIGNPTNEKISKILNSYKEENKLLIGAFLSTKLIAALGLHLNNEEVTILHLSVLPELRGEGVGRKLLSYIASEFPNYRISLETDAEAVEFYRTCGFTCTLLQGKSDNLRYKCSLTLASEIKKIAR